MAIQESYKVSLVRNVNLSLDCLFNENLGNEHVGYKQYWPDLLANKLIRLLEIGTRGLLSAY